MNKLWEYMTRPIHPKDFKTWEEYNKASWKQFWIVEIYNIGISALIVFVGGLILIRIVAILFIK
jgi:hypothetical protein